MKGHVATPPALAEKMVRELFRDRPPASTDRVLYPGCGTGPFAAAVEDVCLAEGWSLPEGLGIDTNPTHLEEATARGLAHVEFREQDFLGDDALDIGPFQYIVGNPPYVPIEGLSAEEKSRYKTRFDAAVGRFDLYLLFFERAATVLADDGRLSFVTPEKYEYVGTAEPLRRRLTNGDVHVTSIEHIDAETFDDLVTFPCVTRVCGGPQNTNETTEVTLRDGTNHETVLPRDGESWASNIRNADVAELETGATLADVTKRVSPGLATGADTVFVMDRNEVPETVDDRWIRPTVGGKQLRAAGGPHTDSVFVCPYTDSGELATEDELGTTLRWLETHRERLEDRSCVTESNDWYQWHETPPMQDILQPKIVFRDIAKEPQFWAEHRGTVVPRHSVYYAVPKDGVPMDALLSYLNSPDVRMWLEAHCQRAHNGYYRLQSRVLSDLPVPQKWADVYQATL